MNLSRKFIESIEKILDFLNSYPNWAKYSVCVGVFFIVSILVFAQRQTVVKASVENMDSASSRGPGYLPTKYLEIKGVKLFPSDPDAQVQVYAIVNETRYRHPAVAGIEWLNVGPNMDTKTIELPEADRYEIRFELKERNGEDISGETTVVEGTPDMTSNVIRFVMDLPYSEEYKLYPINGNVRSANVGATVSFTIYEK